MAQPKKKMGGEVPLKIPKYKVFFQRILLFIKHNRGDSDT